MYIDQSDILPILYIYIYISCRDAMFCCVLYTYEKMMDIIVEHVFCGHG